MADNGNKLYFFEWFLSLLWIAVWGSLSYIAISEKSIYIVGKLSSTSGRVEGLGAVMEGFVMLGAALFGVDWLLRLHPFRQLLRVLLFLGWLSGTTVYFVYFYH